MYERSLALGVPRPSTSSAQRSSSAAIGSRALSTATATGKHAAAQSSTEMLSQSEHTRKNPDALAIAAAVRLSPNVTLAASSKPPDESPPQMLPSTEAAPAPAAPAPAEKDVCTRGWRFWKCRSRRWKIIATCIVVVLVLVGPVVCILACALGVWGTTIMAGYSVWCCFAIKYWDDWMHPSVRANPGKAQFMNSEQGLPVRSPYPR